MILLYSLLFIVFTPIIIACILPAVGKVSAALRNGLALVSVVVPLVFSAALIPLVYHGGSIAFSRHLPLGFDFVLYADALAVFMACVSSLVSAVIVLYSFDYISHYGDQNEYYSMVVR